MCLFLRGEVVLAGGDVCGVVMAVIDFSITTGRVLGVLSGSTFSTPLLCDIDDTAGAVGEEREAG